MRNRLMALAVTTSILAACDGDGSRSPESAEAPPWGLDSVAMPVDKASIIAVFDAFPAEVAGLRGILWRRARHESILSK